MPDDIIDVDYSPNYVFLPCAVDLVLGVWYQRCHDPECRAYRSPALPLPADAWQQGRELHAAFTQPCDPGQHATDAAGTVLQHPYSDKSPPVRKIVHPEASSIQHGIELSALLETASGIEQGILCGGQSLGVEGSPHDGTGCSDRCAVPGPGCLDCSHPATTCSRHAAAPLVEPDDDSEYDLLYLAVLNNLEHKH